MNADPEAIGAKMDALGLWKSLQPFNWAVKPRGTVFPYFCSVTLGDAKPVKVRFLMLEGWQTMHDYIRTRLDRNFGVYSAPIEFPHFELVVLEGGEYRIFRHDTGYMPQVLPIAQRELVAKILWESYGIMLRVEGDRQLPLRFAGERSMFARVEASPGKWEDAPLEIPSPHLSQEKVALEPKLLKAVQDLPLLNKTSLAVDFALKPNLMTREKRPRTVYGLVANKADTGERVIDSRVSVNPEVGLKGLWESMPNQFLLELKRLGYVPGEIQVGSGRVFRFLRSLCVELPFRLSLHEQLKGDFSIG